MYVTDKQSEVNFSTFISHAIKADKKAEIETENK